MSSDDLALQNLLMKRHERDLEQERDLRETRYWKGASQGHDCRARGWDGRMSPVFGDKKREPVCL